MATVMRRLILSILIAIVLPTASSRAEENPYLAGEVNVSVVRAAAGRGDPLAQSALVELFYQGKEVGLGKAAAIEMCRKLAEEGDAASQYNLGMAYVSKLGNNDESFLWFMKAADQGEPRAEAMVGRLIYYGKSGSERNQEKGMDFLLRAAAKGDENAKEVLAWIEENGESRAEPTIAMYREEAKKEDVGWLAMALLGAIYMDGVGIQRDPPEAAYWYRKSAELGFMGGQYGLGNCYISGEGMEEDPVEAVKWYRLAAEQDDMFAQIKLGFAYRDGYGVEADSGESYRWFLKASEMGNKQACIYVGVALCQGSGVSKDFQKGVEYLRRAEEYGYSKATEVRELLEKLEAEGKN